MARRPSTLRLIGITRLSTSAQVRGHGTQRQEELEIGSFADELRAEVIEVWRVEESGLVFDRPKFEACLSRAIELGHHGSIDGVILASVDRLSRDPFTGGAMCAAALRAGLRILFARQRLDTTREEDQDRIVDHLKAARAYINSLKAQTIPARRARSDRGMIPNGQVRWPFDYDPATGKALPNPLRARWIRQWVELLRQEGSLGSIGRLMERHHVPAPKGGIKWSRSTIGRILLDPGLKGEFYCDYERMESGAYWEKSKRVPFERKLIYVDKENAILPDDDWDEIQILLSRNKANSRRNTSHDYGPLHKLVFCVCGRKAGAYTHPRGRAYFRCNVCRTGDVNVAKLWNSVREWLIASVRLSNGLATELSSALGSSETREQLKEDVEALMQELGELDGRIDRALRMGIALPNYQDRMEREIRRIEERQFQAQAELADTTAVLDRLTESEANVSRIDVAIDRFRERLPGASDQEWRQFLLELGVSLCWRETSALGYGW